MSNKIKIKDVLRNTCPCSKLVMIDDASLCVKTNKSIIPSFLWETRKPSGRGARDLGFYTYLRSEVIYAMSCKPICLLVINQRAVVRSRHI